MILTEADILKYATKDELEFLIEIGFLKKMGVGLALAGTLAAGTSQLTQAAPKPESTITKQSYSQKYQGVRSRALESALKQKVISQRQYDYLMRTLRANPNINGMEIMKWIQIQMTNKEGKPVKVHVSNPSTNLQTSDTQVSNTDW